MDRLQVSLDKVFMAGSDEEIKSELDNSILCALELIKEKKLEHPMEVLRAGMEDQLMYPAGEHRRRLELAHERLCESIDLVDRFSRGDKSLSVILRGRGLLT